MKTLLIYFSILVVVYAGGSAAFAQPFDPRYPPRPPMVNSQHQRTAPLATGQDTTEACYGAFANYGC